jgi:non-specific serine/threonine protein kinase
MSADTKLDAWSPLTAAEQEVATLTAREREIAGLLADELSNRELAERLVISEGTVEVHVKHILSKLEFRSHTQVAAWFADRRSAGEGR